MCIYYLNTFKYCYHKDKVLNNCINIIHAKITNRLAPTNENIQQKERKVKLTKKKENKIERQENQTTCSAESKSVKEQLTRNIYELLLTKKRWRSKRKQKNRKSEKWHCENMTNDKRKIRKMFTERKE